MTEPQKHPGVGLLERDPDPPLESPVGNQGPLQLDFPSALRSVMAGRSITRLVWQEPDTCVVQVDGFLCIQRHGDLHRLLVTDGDLFADDWVVVTT